MVALSAAAALLIALSFPAVRTVAQQFLDLFRVQRFVAVSADPERLKQIARIANEGFDVKSLLSRNVKVVKEPTELQPVESVAAAEQLTGLTVQLPATLPRDVVQEQMVVVRERVPWSLPLTLPCCRTSWTRWTLRDVLVPQQLNGAVVKIRMPPQVITKYQRNGMAQALLMQAASPEISLPPGVHLPEIVEIALRILGMSLDEARQYAYSIDWHGTLLVPVPADVASFREVDVGTSQGLLIESNGQPSLGTSGLVEENRARWYCGLMAARYFHSQERSTRGICCRWPVRYSRSLESKREDSTNRPECLTASLRPGNYGNSLETSWRSPA